MYQPALVNMLFLWSPRANIQGHVVVGLFISLCVECLWVSPQTFNIYLTFNLYKVQWSYLVCMFCKAYIFRQHHRLSPFEIHIDPMTLAGFAERLHLQTNFQFFPLQMGMLERYLVAVVTVDLALATIMCKYCSLIYQVNAILKFI